jgi:ABC-type thiamine transport system ATPase subunit
LKNSFRDDYPIASAQLWFQDQSSVLLDEKSVSDLDESIHVILSNLIQQLTDTHVATRLVMAHTTSDGLLSQSEVGLWAHLGRTGVLMVLGTVHDCCN